MSAGNIAQKSFIIGVLFIVMYTYIDSGNLKYLVATGRMVSISGYKLCRLNYCLHSFFYYIFLVAVFSVMCPASHLASKTIIPMSSSNSISIFWKNIDTVFCLLYYMHIYIYIYAYIYIYVYIYIYIYMCIALNLSSRFKVLYFLLFCLVYKHVYCY